MRHIAWLQSFPGGSRDWLSKLVNSNSATILPDETFQLNDYYALSKSVKEISCFDTLKLNENSFSKATGPLTVSR